jgi:hypothetical protein
MENHLSVASRILEEEILRSTSVQICLQVSASKLPRLKAINMLPSNGTVTALLVTHMASMERDQIASATPSVRKMDQEHVVVDGEMKYSRSLKRLVEEVKLTNH